MILADPTTRTEWLQCRRQGIGGSDAGCITGANPWKSARQLWREKTGVDKPDDISDKPAVKFGKEAEQHLRALFLLTYPQYTCEYHEFRMYANDRLPFIFATLDGEVFAETDDLSSIRLPLPKGGTRRSSLNITVHTAQGRCLGLSRSIQVLPAAAEPAIQLTGKALKNTFPRTDNCRAYLEENVVRLKVTSGASSFMLPMMKLHADQSAWVALKIPQASAAWSVHLYLNSTGEAIPVQPQWQRTGEYLLPLNGLLRSKGLEQANVKVMFTIASGGAGEITLEYLNVYTQTK